jgi:outer membrane lipoprotein carrier protein
MRWTLLFIIILWVLQSQVYADPAADLTVLLSQVKTLQADFTQTIIDDKSTVIQKSTGRMMLRQPGQFRWEVERPVRQLIVANGQQLWIYDPDLEQVTVRRLTNAGGETPALLLSDTDQALARHFKVQVLPASGRMQRFLLVPKGRDSLLSQIHLNFVSQHLDEMVLQDHLGHTTTIKFNHLVTPVSFSAKLFYFTPPPQVDIIRENS